jgi:hypothetical protein
MSEKTMIINIQDLANGGKKLLSGRENGKSAYTKCKLINLDKDGTLILRNDTGVVISNSYFLGMLTDVFVNYDSKKKMLEHIDFKGLSETNRKELVRGINRGFSQAINFMA